MKYCWIHRQIMQYENMYVLLLFYIHLSDGRKNVLFLVADDMRPELGAYFGKTYPPYQSTQMHTPNIDALASKSLLMERSYAQQALCGPSRASLLTGRRPDTTRVYQCKQYFRQTGGNFTTIPQYFKEHGYKSIGMGKIFHFKKNPGGDDPVSWSEPYFHGDDNFADEGKSWSAIPDYELKKEPLLDEQTADHAVKTLRRLATEASKQPFFMAVGFRRPHLPFVFPKSYLKYYPSVKLPDNLYAPVNMPDISWYSFNRIRKYKDTKKYKATGGINATETLPNEKVLELRRAYYCCVTWVDAMVGRVLSELDRLGLSNNTIVSFIGDHGYHLGENGLWCKMTNFELSTHAPMMIRIPGVTDSGIKTKQLSELVDLFPTLAEAAGLPPLPMCPRNSSSIQVCREGRSLLPLIKEPNKPIKRAAFSQHPRAHAMGYSLRTNRYRYTEWPTLRNNYDMKWTTLQGIELYDHLKDPEENVNRAFDRKYKLIREELSQLLQGMFRYGEAEENDDSSVMLAKQTLSANQTLSKVLSGKQTPSASQTLSQVMTAKKTLSQAIPAKKTLSQATISTQEMSQGVSAFRKKSQENPDTQKVSQKMVTTQELSRKVRVIKENIWFLCILATVVFFIFYVIFRDILMRGLKCRH